MKREKAGGLSFLELSVLELTAVDDGIAVFGVSCLPEGLSLRPFPDERLDGFSRIEGSREAACDSFHHFWLSGGKARDEGPACETQGAHAVHDGLFEPGFAGEGRNGVQGVIVTGEAVEKRLVRRRKVLDGEIGRSLRK